MKGDRMYLFYIDESASRDVTHLEKERFYVLTAVGMYEGHWKGFHFEIDSRERIILARIR